VGLSADLDVLLKNLLPLAEFEARIVHSVA
jgi:hypothetical protein